MTTLYGIKNCDTMKKSFARLESNNITYKFHDYKKDGIDSGILKQAIDEHGWDKVLNKRGTTWRNLPKTVQDSMNDTKAITIAEENPSIIKRPLLYHKKHTYLGFDEKTYKELLG